MKKYLGGTLMLVLMALALLAGCGGGSVNCSYTELSISPAKATADHAAAPPGNWQQFIAFGNVPRGCVTTAANLPIVTWSVSDTTDVSVSNGEDGTFGVATCIHTTRTPVTVTASLPGDGNKGHGLTGTAAMSCN